MSDWTEGYVTDVGYIFGYYRELSPLHAKIALHDCNVACPEVQTACELGFGQGMSINIHAAASKTQWYGTDFIPQQADFARQMAKASGADAHIFNDSFEAFAQRKDLPDFDFIGLHGIWSWISNNNRRIIVDFIKKKLKPGGVLYVSYNTLPGWADFVSMRHLMTRYMADMTSPRQNRLEQISGCVDFLDNFLATNPLFAQINPFVRIRMQRIHGGDTHYLAHEYFNRDWLPMHFADMARWLQDTKLDYVCSARYLSHINQFYINIEQENFLNSIQNPVFRETMRDFMVNCQFRLDYWVKGVRELSKREKEEWLQTQRYILIVPQSDITLKVDGTQGSIDLDPELYNPILELMADYRPRTLHQIEEEIQKDSITFSQLYQAIIVLLGKAYIEPVQEEESIAQVKFQTMQLNSFLCQQALTHNGIGSLASPLTGGGIYIDLIVQLFVKASQQGKSEPQQWAEYAWQQLSAVGRQVIKDGKLLESSEENLAELRVRAEEFAQKRLPILKGLGIA